MFATIKQIFSRQNKDLQKRIIFTLVCLFLFIIGTAIVVPGINKSELLGELGFLDLVNTLGGGALSNFSIFALGVIPYITASIVMQFLQLDIIPYFSELAKQGQVGRNKLNQITRVMGICLAFLQGYFFAFATLKGTTMGSPINYIEIAAILTAGTALLLWVGDQITTKGIGNGISLIIMAGILSTMPGMFKDAWVNMIDTSSTQGTTLGAFLFILFILVYIGIIVGIVFVELSERRIPIQYANKTTSNFGGRQNYIPFKLNSGGVMPVIFASALISIPNIIANFISNEGVKLFISKYLTLHTITGLIIYIIAIFGFTYFYTFIQLKPKEIADNLNKNGGYIPGIRPGEETITYIKKILKRITLLGATSLAFVAGLPIIFSLLPLGLPSNVSLGGTGMIIIVGVALETYKQIEGQLISRSYKGRGF